MEADILQLKGDLLTSLNAKVCNMVGELSHHWLATWGNWIRQTKELGTSKEIELKVGVATWLYREDMFVLYVCEIEDQLGSDMIYNTNLNSI